MPIDREKSRAFPVGEYVADGLRDHGWSTSEAAARIPGDHATNTLWLDLICCQEIWFSHDIRLSLKEACDLGLLFGTSAELWVNLDRSFQRQKRAEQN